MLSSILHLFYIVLAVVASLILFNDYRKSKEKNKYLRDFAIFFVLFIFYRFFLSLYIFTENVEIAGWGYNLSVMILFIMAAVVWDIPLSILGAKLKSRRITEWALIAVGVAVVIVQIIDFRLPIVHPSGIIVWNANPITSFITSLAGFIVGVTWAYTFGINFKSNADKGNRLKVILIITGSLLIAFASLTYYYSNYYSMIASFTMSFLGSVSLLAAVSVSYMKKASSIKVC